MLSVKSGPNLQDVLGRCAAVVAAVVTIAVATSVKLIAEKERNSDTPTEAYVPRTDPHAIPEMPEMVEMGRVVEMKATAI